MKRVPNDGRTYVKNGMGQVHGFDNPANAAFHVKLYGGHVIDDYHTNAASQKPRTTIDKSITKHVEMLPAIFSVADMVKAGFSLASVDGVIALLSQRGIIERVTSAHHMYKKV